MSALKNLLNGILSFFTGLFSSKKKAAPNSEADAKAAIRKAAAKGIFLEADEARGYTSPEVKAEATAAKAQVNPDPKPAPEPTPAPAPITTAAALNLPAPEVVSSSTSAAKASSNGGPTFFQFGARRRPGASMNPFLEMARQVNVRG